ncbi:hypothetical protein DXG03_009547 [Asterophora parasitica]|uniref:Mitochondrial splicing suppressor 51-like C-terminal domain-containing protein n=1 Tax=Asterophora parasitica TaxID=117018 RepID=A0A9P7G815_9AGAR|nr:hypothetical protein DXG03_009547 [Asterophora parasitica]
MNQEIRQDVAFETFISGANQGEFRWAPERVKPSWSSLKNGSWGSEFQAELVSTFGVSSDVVGPFLRSASVGLSMPMTILWALEHLNDDESWTRKNTLTIHLLGAYEIEVMNAQTFEEILHRLPDVNNLKLVLCGPELVNITSARERNQEINMETCPNCSRDRRKRVHQLFPQPYHDMARGQGNKFVKPDLAIAFNSGSSQQAVESWKETIAFLSKNEIPTVFTAYNREEAEVEAQLLKLAGRHLVPSLGPIKNPWGSILARKEPNKVTGFYAVNGWLAGGFR